ncbi:MAG: hypothetical protein IPJ28_11190 [Betaproteobacteria bacterium]|nr:hypothetical protein [Betaproteobacteria bacterium]
MVVPYWMVTVVAAPLEVTVAPTVAAASLVKDGVPVVAMGATALQSTVVKVRLPPFAVPDRLLPRARKL